MEIQGYSRLTCIYSKANSLVYRAIRDDNLPVVLKTLRSEQPSTREVLKTRREFEILQKIDLDGVIGVYDLIPYQYKIVLVLEDFGAVSLDFVIKEGPFALREFLELAIKLADTLGHIHQQGIIHRDIKPANIVLNRADGRIKYIDFKIASLISGVRLESVAPEHLEGTLAYIAPEQTGRMNKGLDHRADLYSLGGTLHEMLTGVPPFQETDARKLIHAHIAQPPPPVSLARDDIPQPVSDLILRLLSKNVEDRYKSSFGLKKDLEQCYREFCDTGSIHTFQLAKRDPFTFFHIPEKLYGRRTEIHVLEHAINNAINGQGGIRLVCGAPGVGKSALIRDLFTPGRISESIFFASGKFDQYSHDSPYSALVMALQGVLRRILCAPSEVLQDWKEKLTVSVGGNGVLLCALLPELQLIIGEQPEVEQFSSAQEQNRFSLLFQRFIQTLATKEHPLVLFIDDLQWADPETLGVLNTLLVSDAQRYVLIIGAYRDNEVGPSHPLSFFIDKLKNNNVSLQIIQIQPLSLKGVVDLVEDAFLPMAETQGPADLAKIVTERTLGNPFYIKQYLKQLYLENLLFFDLQAQAWYWDKKGIHKTEGTPNCVEFLCARLGKLSSESQQILTIAACIGNRFNLKLLLQACNKPSVQTLRSLDETIKAGFVLPLNAEYKYIHLIKREESQETIKIEEIRFLFLHDRVQQAAYLLINEKERELLHYRIGSLVLQQRNERERERNLFFIVNHLNLGRAHVVSPEERLDLAELNLASAKKAKQSSAYADAAAYLAHAMEVLPETCWQDNYDLALEIHQERSDCEYLAGAHETAEELFTLLLSKAKTPLTKAQIYRQRASLYQMQGRYQQAMEAATTGLQLLGLNLPIKPGKLRVLWDTLRIQLIILFTKKEDLPQRPRLDDLDKKECLDMLITIGASAYYVSNNLFVLIVCKSAAISLKYGHTRGSGAGYCGYAIVMGSVFGRYRVGYDWGKLGLQISRLLGDQQSECVGSFLVGGLVGHWRKPLLEQFKYTERAYSMGLTIGEHVYAGFAMAVQGTLDFAIGRHLKEVKERLGKSIEVLRSIHHEGMVAILLTFSDTVKVLNGSDQQVLQNEDTTYNEKYGPMLYAHSLVSVLFRTFLFCHYQEALELCDRIDKTEDALLGQFMSVWHNVFSSLTMTSLYNEVSWKEKRRFRSKIASNQRKMKIWMRNCPENFSHFYFLVAAEQARISGKAKRAMLLYLRAIQAASQGNFIHYEAIAHEFAARFAKEQQHHLYHVSHIREARYCYLRWGAFAKMKEIEERFPAVFFQNTLSSTRETIVTQTLSSTQSSTVATSESTLDMQTVFATTQEISSEVVLPKLLQKLMAIVFESAGAEQGFLLLLDKGQVVVRAQGTPELVEVNLEKTVLLSDLEAYVETVIHYVIRTQEPIILRDASKDERFGANGHFAKKTQTSILCLPLIRQGTLLGLLYLENSISSGAFTEERLKLLSILANQITISIENALLYTNLEEKVEERTLELNNALEEIRQISNTDPLTNIPNRRFFFELAAMELERSVRYKRPFTFLMLDIDFFKKINDTRGHKTGDIVLKELSQILVQNLREVDLIARIGGEEFAILLPELSFSQAKTAAERLRNAVAQKTFTEADGEGRFSITVSLGGVSFHPSKETDIQQLYSQADQALYRSKEQGRNRVTFWEDFEQVP